MTQIHLFVYRLPATTIYFYKKKNKENDRKLRAQRRNQTKIVLYKEEHTHMSVARKM